MQNAEGKNPKSDIVLVTRLMNLQALAEISRERGDEKAAHDYEVEAHQTLLLITQSGAES